ncbi:MAG: N-acetylmuramoyl-L-alanine amidase, partial [Anaerolineales bacterium]|nr:N-acetylmuramoyl-L-alanine amidase [Anaerolineales bacterium]
RDFLRIAGTNLGAILLPIQEIEFSTKGFAWPILRLNQLPFQIQEILDRVPETLVTSNGRLYLMDTDGNKNGYVPLAQTQWNRENSFLSDKLYKTVPWGIVLHWYGDRENYDKTITGYLRGFDSLREVDGELIRTSAHFLVDGDLPTIDSEASESQFGILQTQKPHASGTPYVSSHINGLDYEAHENRKNYFVRAQYHLGYEEPGVHTILQNWFDGGQNIDPNMRTIAIEMTGYDYESRQPFPSKQKIANAISLIWALMRRYNITANNIFGHNEIQLNKPDPGKKFMGFMRYLIGAKAMLDNDPQMNQLVFGNFLYEQKDTLQAVKRYFKYVYDYL